jgi:two-component system chemotaxis response regulator CheY
MGRPTRIALIEDDDGIRETLELALADEGYEVLTAANGASGLQVVAAGRPDVILLDMKMPTMDGWAFARSYRELPGPKAPLLVITAANAPDRRAEEIGATAYLSKPFDLDELMAMVRRLVGHAEG